MPHHKDTNTKAVFRRSRYMGNPRARYTQKNGESAKFLYGISVIGNEYWNGANLLSILLLANNRSIPHEATYLLADALHAHNLANALKAAYSSSNPKALELFVQQQCRIPPEEQQKELEDLKKWKDSFLASQKKDEKPNQARYLIDTYPKEIKEWLRKQANLIGKRWFEANHTSFFLAMISQHAIKGCNDIITWDAWKDKSVEQKIEFINQQFELGMISFNIICWEAWEEKIDSYITRSLEEKPDVCETNSNEKKGFDKWQNEFWQLFDDEGSGFKAAADKDVATGGAHVKIFFEQCGASLHKESATDYAVRESIYAGIGASLIGYEFIVYPGDAPNLLGKALKLADNGAKWLRIDFNKPSTAATFGVFLKKMKVFSYNKKNKGNSDESEALANFLKLPDIREAEQAYYNIVNPYRDFAIKYFNMILTPEEAVETMVKKIKIAVSTSSDSTSDVFANAVFSRSDSTSSDDESSSISIQHQRGKLTSPATSNSFDPTSSSDDEHSPIPTAFRRRWSSPPEASKNAVEKRMKGRLEYWKEGVSRLQQRLLENDNVDENFNVVLTLASEIIGNNHIKADIVYLMTQSENHRSIIWKFCSSLLNETIDIAKRYIFADLRVNIATISMPQKQYDNTSPKEMYIAMYKEMCKGYEYQRSDRLARFVIEVTKEFPFKLKMTLISDVLSILQLQYIIKLKEIMQTSEKEDQFVIATETAAFLFWIGDVFLTPELIKCKDAVLDDSQGILKSVFNEFLKKNLLYFGWLDETADHFGSYSFFMMHFFEKAIMHYCDAPTVACPEDTKPPKAIVEAYVRNELSTGEAISKLNELLADDVKREDNSTIESGASTVEPLVASATSVVPSHARMWQVASAKKNAGQLSESNDSEHGHERELMLNR